jgi:hypothetical protein
MGADGGYSNGTWGTEPVKLTLPTYNADWALRQKLWSLLESWETEIRTASRARKKLLNKKSDELWLLLMEDQ